MMELVTCVLVAHERNILNFRQQLELDILIQDEGLKVAVQTAVGEGEPRLKRVRAFLAVCQALVPDGVPGVDRIVSASPQSVAESILRFKPAHAEPRTGWQWKWTLALGPSATNRVRDGVADLAAHGGVAGKVLVRRPQLYLGPLVQELANQHLPQGGKGRGGGYHGGHDGGHLEAAPGGGDEKGGWGRGKGKGGKKAKGKDKDKGKKGKDGKGKGKGKGGNDAKGKNPALPDGRPPVGEWDAWGGLAFRDGPGGGVAGGQGGAAVGAGAATPAGLVAPPVPPAFLPPPADPLSGPAHTPAGNLPARVAEAAIPTGADGSGVLKPSDTDELPDFDAEEPIVPAATPAGTPMMEDSMMEDSNASNDLDRERQKRPAEAAPLTSRKSSKSISPSR